ncbi:hypothetical protein EJB05_17698, partial [Eragrostis curvula]
MWLGLLLCTTSWSWLIVIFNLKAVGTFIFISMIPVYVTRWMTAKGFKCIPFILKSGGVLGLVIILINHEDGEHWLHQVACIVGIVCRVIELMISVFR